MHVKMIPKLATYFSSFVLLFYSFSTVQTAPCYIQYRAVRYYRLSYCTCWWWGWCTHRRRLWRSYYVWSKNCCPGYRGSNCDTPICNCQNGGTCVAPNVCRCRNGYTGNSCQTPICYPGCLHGHCISPSTCRCYSGYTGSSCSQPVCSSPCQSGGTCVGPNTCRCPGNQAGPTCNKPLCSPPCLNGGECSQSHTCLCSGTGYTGQSCQTPVCNPTCKNGGTCVSPDTCSCIETYTGNTCDTPLCAHHDPCFPGECSNLVNCACTAGFTGSNGIQRCKSFESDNAAIITKCSAFLANIERTGKKREMYRFMTDSSEPNSTEVDMLWLSQKDYNYINADFTAIYTSPEITSQPDYVEEFKFGIVGGWMQLDLTKVPRNASNKAFVSLNRTTYPCPNQPGSLNPDTSVYSCNVTHFDFDRLLEDGDNLTLTVIAQNGGYRKLKTSSTATYKDPFIGQNSTKSMMYRFDFRKPYHCILETQCSLKAFTVKEDITKSPIQFSWDGWADVLSGIGKYTIQEFLLQPDQNVNPNLTEPNPWSPTKTFTFTNTERNFTYSPKQPGMYSFILNIVDRANNSEYARTLVLYDNTSSITTDAASPMISTSAEKDTNYRWQNSLTNNISISWKGHFRNVLHENKKLLIRVSDYKHFDHDKKFQKRVLPKLDDNDGKRTLHAIDNIHGIVKFEYDFGNANQGSKTPTSWRTINDLTETVTFNIARRDGDTLNVWIRATDVLGNVQSDLMHVYFDETPPVALTLDDVEFFRNLKNSTFPFTSRLEVNTHDKHSGIHRIDWTFSSYQTGEIFKSGFIPGNKTIMTTLKYTEGYDIPMGDKFYYSHFLDIDNCWMVVPKESFQNESVNLNLTVYNRAMESTTFMTMISDLESLDGIDEYSGPTNLRIEKTYDNGVRLRWTVSPSCYERTRIVVLVVAKDGRTYTRLVDKDAEYFDLTGLDAETVYNLSFVTAYAAQKSNPVFLSFRTAESPAALTAGGIAGISIVMILLLGIIIAGVIMWRTGRLSVAKQGIQRRVTVVRERIQNRFSAARYNASFEDQDDIYLYGQMNVNTSDDWIIPHSSVVLETLLTSGRFADIYKIRYCPQNSSSRGKYVAKVLKSGYTEEQQMSMRAKINFYATKVGEHSNILHFYGAVFDDEALGPYMVLEYCELGQLNTWLQEQKITANEETSEQLCRIVYGISKGMLHFENRKLVHRRLAARNVLLTSELEPKIYGFCPQQQTAEGDHKDDDGDVKDDKERIPIKWAAPECLVSMKYATPKSDVWSFGVVLWEIFSFGDVPYPGVRSRDVQMHLRNGNRMSRPEFANDFYYNLMKQCWQRKAKQRPSFCDITAEIGKTFNTVPSDDFYYYSEKQ